jgi:ribosomal protein S15P/S13E
MSTWTKEEVINIIKELSKETKDLATIGHRLRDEYLILNVKTYGIKLKNILKIEGINYDLLVLMKKIVPLHKHVLIHKRDTHNRVQYNELISRIKSIIQHYKTKKLIEENFRWSPEDNERIIGRLSL